MWVELAGWEVVVVVALVELEDDCCYEGKVAEDDEEGDVGVKVVEVKRNHSELNLQDDDDELRVEEMTMKNLGI
jgi:hypothetical protein